jgi:hypothetical protein
MFCAGVSSRTKAAHRGVKQSVASLSAAQSAVPFVTFCALGMLVTLAIHFGSNSF